MADLPPKGPSATVDAQGNTTVQVDHVDRQTPAPFGTILVNADPFESKKPPRKGINKWVIAQASKPFFDAAIEEIRDLGGIATSSGGIRDLGTTVTKARSGTSFHYTGRALDLYIYSGMVDPATDPYIVTADGEIGVWRIFARTTKPEVPELTLTAIKFKRVKNDAVVDPVTLSEVEVTGHFFDITAIFDKHGCKRISAKEDFLADENARAYQSAEWWHFQDENGLVVGATTFGSLLRQVRTEAELKGTKVFESKDLKWNGSTFK